MKSRISFFNSTVLRKDLTRFAPVWGLYLVGGLLVGLNTMGNIGRGHVAMNLMETLNALAVLNLIYAAVCAQMLFGDLFNSKLCNALHALPLRRETWFATHTVAGMAFSVVPNLILSLCFLPLLGENWFLAFVWLLGMTLEYLFFFGVAALSCILTGSRIGMAAVYAVINFISVIIYWFVDTFYAPLLVGLDIRAEGFLRFCPAAWIAAELDEFAQFEYVALWLNGYQGSRYEYLGLTDAWWYLAILAALGLAALVLGVVLYRRRRLESAGDLLAFKPLEPVFAVIATLSSGAVFQVMGDLFAGNANYIYLAVGILVGYFASRMLLQRRVKVFQKKAFLGCAAIVGAMGLSLLLTWLDPLGVTRWVPEVDEVASVTVAEDYAYNEKYGSGRAIVLEDPDLIASVTQAHECLIEEDVGDWYGDSVPVTLVYEMKDGRQVRRHYYYPTGGKAAEVFAGLFSDPAYVLGYLEWDTFLNGIESVEVNWQYKMVGDEARQLAEAICADCEAGTMVQSRGGSDYAACVQIHRHDRDIYVDIFEDCENTLAWLKENIPQWVVNSKYG